MPRVLFASAGLPSVDFPGIFAPKYGTRYSETETGGYHQHSYDPCHSSILASLSILVVSGLLGCCGVERDAGGQYPYTCYCQAYTGVFLPYKFIRYMIAGTVTIEGGDRTVLFVTAYHGVWPPLCGIG